MGFPFLSRSDARQHDRELLGSWTHLCADLWNHMIEGSRSFFNVLQTFLQVVTPINSSSLSMPGLLERMKFI